MASDSEDEADNVEDAEYDEDDADDEELDRELLDAITANGEDGTEADPDSDDDDSDEDSDEDDEPSPQRPPSETPTPAPPAVPAKRSSSSPPPGQRPAKAPTPPSSEPPALTPARIRRNRFKPSVFYPRTYTVEAICALPHPVPTHSLAATPCMSHLLTGSEDGYIRDYDIFSAVNGKVFLSAPQRHHAGVVEGILKAGQIRSWWENPSSSNAYGEEPPPVHSLAIHGDALWGLAGTNNGVINLYTVRHEPGTHILSMPGHRGPVSALSLQHDEKGFFSAGWDGDALQWDLNTGQIVRRFTAHGAQLAALAIRPLDFDYPVPPPPVNTAPRNTSSKSQMINTDRRANDNVNQPPANETLVMAPPANLAGSTHSSIPAHQSQEEPSSSLKAEADVKSEDGSVDSLFGDEPDAEGDPEAQQKPDGKAAPSVAAVAAAAAAPAAPQTQPSRPAREAPVPKNAPPILDPVSYASFSPDLLMTAAMDGQVVLWDCRVATPVPGNGVGRLWMSEKTPPWCLSACWSMNGAQIYAGRRNGTIDVWDLRQLGRSGPTETPRLLKTLKNPASSGVVSCVAAFPDGRHIACASNDNIRLWNAAEAGEGDVRGRVQFKIIPGHHGGIVSQMVIDPGARFLVSASGNRGWHGDGSRTVFVHEIKMGV